MWTAWIEAIAAIATAGAAVYAAVFGIRTFRYQKSVNDVDLSFRIFSEINRYWDRVIDGSETKDYDYGQILSYFEIAATLLNNGILSKDAEKILTDHIIEVFSDLKSSEAGKALLERCRSSNSTFADLQNFAAKRFTKVLLAQSFGDRLDPI